MPCQPGGPAAGLLLALLFLFPGPGAAAVPTRWVCSIEVAPLTPAPGTVLMAATRCAPWARPALRAQTGISRGALSRDDPVVLDVEAPAATAVATPAAGSQALTLLAPPRVAVARNLSDHPALLHRVHHGQFSPLITDASVNVLAAMHGLRTCFAARARAMRRPDGLSSTACDRCDPSGGFACPWEGLLRIAAIVGGAPTCAPPASALRELSRLAGATGAADARLVVVQCVTVVRISASSTAELESEVSRLLRLDLNRMDGDGDSRGVRGHRQGRARTVAYRADPHTA